MDNSPLRLLPGELRNKIMTLVFSETVINLKQPDNRTRFGRTKGSSKWPTAVLKTCKQLYNENLKLFYFSCPITIHAPVGTLSFTIFDFLSSLNPFAAEAVKNVTIKCNAGERDGKRFGDKKLSNPVGHALLQLQKPLSVRVKLELRYIVANGRMKRIVLDSGDLQATYLKARERSLELRQLGVGEDIANEPVEEMMGKNGVEDAVK